MNNDLVILDSINEVKSYSSLPFDNDDNKVVVYNALTNPDERLMKFINMTLNITDVIITHVDVVNDESGEINNVPRVVLIDDEKKSYVAVSKGIYNAISLIIGIMGEPITWQAPLPVKVISIPLKERSMLSLELVN